MAKKQTLKSLLGASDQRVEVEYDGITPTLSPTVNPESGYQAVVQATPKTNKLLNLVDAMNKVPNLYKTGIQMAQNAAAEEIAGLDDTEIAKRIAGNDKETMSIFGYNKAYNEGLVDRHYKVNAKKYADEFASLAADLDAHPDPTSFNKALENKVNEIKAENEALFGTNSFQVNYNNEAFQAVMGETITKASGTYLDNQQEAVIVQYNTDWLEDIRAGVDVKTAFNNYKTKLSSLPLSNSEKSKLLLEQVEAGYNTFRENGEFTKAKKLLDDAEKYEIIKGGKLGAGKNSNTFKRLRDDLEDKSATKNQVTVSRQVQRVTGLYNRVSNDIMNGKPNDENIKDLIQTLRPNMPETVIDEKIMEINGIEGEVEKVEALGILINDLGNKTYDTTAPSDITAEVADRLGSITSTYEQDIKVKPIEYFTGLSEDQEDNLITIAENGYFENNPDDTVKLFMEKQGYRGVQPPKSLFGLFNKAHALDYIKRMDSVKELDNTLSTLLDGTIKGIPAFKNSTSVERESTRSAMDSTLLSKGNELREKIKKYALTLSGTQEEKEKLINKYIEQEVDKFVETEALIFEAESIFDQEQEKNKTIQERRTFNTGDETDTILESKTQASIDALTNQGQNVEERYPHLFEASYAINALRQQNFVSGDKIRVPNRQKNGEVIGSKELSLKEIYKDIRSRNDKKALQATQRLYGYSKFTPQIAEDLKQSSLTSYEVKLFGSFDELLTILDKYAGVLTKFNNDPDSLNNSENKILKEAASFGIYDEESHKAFFETQTRNLREF